MTGLLDQYGTPLTASPAQQKALAEVYAAPTWSGERPAVSGQPIFRLNPGMLGEALRAADAGDSLRWQQVASDLERRDAHYTDVLNTRKRVVSQLPITVEAASSDPEHEKHAEFLRDWLKTGVLAGVLYDILDAIAKGWSVLEMEWAFDVANVRPVKIDFCPQRWFDISPQDGRTVLMRSDASVIAPPLIDGALGHVGFAPLLPDKFIVHHHPTWSGLPIEAGLARVAAWLLMYKFFTLRDWAVFVQNYGLPIRVGKYGPSASNEDKAVMRAALSAIGGSLSALVPESMQFDFVEPKGGSGSSSIHELRANWIDSQLSKLVLGQTGTTDTKQGAHASSSTHREVQEDIERADALLLSVTVTRQVAWPIIRRSFGEQAGGYPTIRVGRPDEIPFQELINMIQWLGPQGLRVRAQDVYDRAGLAPPEDGDETVGIAAQGGGGGPAPGIQPEQLDAPEDKPPQTQLPKPGERQEASGEDKVATHRMTRLTRLMARAAAEDGPAVVEQLTTWVARKATPIVNGLTDEVMDALMGAVDETDMLARLSALKLSPDALADAMAQGMALAELMGEADMLAEMPAPDTAASHIAAPGQH